MTLLNQNAIAFFPEIATKSFRVIFTISPVPLAAMPKTESILVTSIMR